MPDSFETAGYALQTDFVASPVLERLSEACASVAAQRSVHHRSGATYGVRGLLWSSVALRRELEDAGLAELAGRALGGSAFPIEAILFDKQANANWGVPGHHDRLMPVAAGSGPAKARRGDIDYAEPSVATLESLVALRVHLDDAGADGGALQVVPGSHRRGILGAEALKELPSTDYELCSAARGDVLLMRPLLVHRSRRHEGAGHRRVLHVVYASTEPDEPYRWRRIERMT